VDTERGSDDTSFCRASRAGTRRQSDPV